MNIGFIIEALILPIILILLVSAYHATDKSDREMFIGMASFFTAIVFVINLSMMVFYFASLYPIGTPKGL